MLSTQINVCVIYTRLYAFMVYICSVGIKCIIICVYGYILYVSMSVIELYIRNSVLMKIAISFLYIKLLEFVAVYGN